MSGSARPFARKYASRKFSTYADKSQASERDLVPVVAPCDCLLPAFESSPSNTAAVVVTDSNHKQYSDRSNTK